MSQATRDQFEAILANGLMNYVNVTNDNDYLKMTPVVLGDVKDVFVENIRANDFCMFAFPSMVVQPDIRVECFVAILDDRVIVAWRKELIMKKTVSRVIPKQSIKQASWAVSNEYGSRGVPLLTILADDTTNIAMPKGKPAVADVIVAAVQQVPRQGLPIDAQGFI
jgi:hypothetical protein